MWHENYRPSSAVSRVSAPDQEPLCLLESFMFISLMVPSIELNGHAQFPVGSVLF